MTTQDQAMAALEATREAERQLAAAVACPPWRHALFGAIMGALVATPALPLALRFGALVLILIAIAMIVQADRRRMGMFVNGYRRGRTLFVAIPLLAATLVLYLFSARAGAAGDLLTPLWLGLAAFVVAVVGSVAWQRVFVRELGA